MVTIFFVNQQEERKRQHEPKDEVWVFQPKLRVRGVKNEPIFIQRKETKVEMHSNPTVPKLHEDRNLRTHRKIRSGDVVKGFRNSDLVVEDSCWTQKDGTMRH